MVMDLHKLRKIPGTVKIFDKYLETSKNEAVIYNKEFDKDSFVFRLTVKTGMVTGVYPRTMLAIKSKTGRYKYRKVQPFSKMASKYARFSVPKGHSLELTFLADNEGVLRDANITLELKS